MWFCLGSRIWAKLEFGGVLSIAAQPTTNARVATALLLKLAFSRLSGKFLLRWKNVVILWLLRGIK